MAEQAAISLPGDCDLLDVPLNAGLLALARMDLRGRATGPAWTLHEATDGRLLLPLSPGAAAELPALLCWLGWAHLDGVLRGHEAGQLRTARRKLREGRSPAPEPLARLVDTCADACARTQLHHARLHQAPHDQALPVRVPPQRTPAADQAHQHAHQTDQANQPRLSCAPSRTPRGCCSAPGRAR
ncbi:hypothetical protein [Streptacidiphilus sp. MAP12-20]|uniref:hypothetical protein n=1 Tax=Streptacidiphilus sp. MAP12-20 TaxID=3156299 RepID=UPI003512183C